jgi:nucleotide-binding universal stress UspA family protein
MTTSEHENGSRIVVGVDGSPSSRDALRWAVKQAVLSGADVEAITTWEHPASIESSSPIPAEELAKRAAAALADSVREVVGEDDPPVDICQSVACGHAARVLLEAAHGADLLVLGSRGHGGFTGALLGSVGQHCVHHAPCPVVIVRHKKN